MIVLLNKLNKLLKKPLSQKMAFSSPRPGCLGTALPPESVRTGVRTLTSQPKFLASIGNYQICLPMVLCSASFGRKEAPLSINMYIYIIIPYNNVLMMFMVTAYLE